MNQPPPQLPTMLAPAPPPPVYTELKVGKVRSSHWRIAVYCTVAINLNDLVRALLGL